MRVPMSWLREYVDLAPGESRSVRFALAWDLPVVEFGAGRRWYKRYTRDWGRTGERAFETVDPAMHRTACACLGKIEADAVDVSVRALQSQ